MENKFNLTAEVNLQLAKGSGANLIKQLDQVKAELAVNLNQGKVKSAAKKAKQEAEKFLNDITIDIKVGKVDGDPILKTLKKGVAKVLVNFEASNQSIKNWESLFKPKTVDVKMKISESNKKAFLKQFESVFDLKGSGLSVKLKEVVKDAAKSIKRNDIANALEDIVDVKVGPRKSGGNNRKSAAQEIKEYISLLGTYEKAAKAADKAEGRTGEGSTRRKSRFFAQAKKEVDAVAKLLGNETNIAERFNFEGNENSAKDFKNAIDSVYRSLVKLNDLEAKLRSARGKARSTRSIDKNLQQIDQAREDIRANLVNFDVKNPKAFGTNIASILTRISGETGDAIQTFKRDFTDYQRLLAGLRQDKATALAKGLEKEAAILDQLIKKTEQLRKGRRSLNKDTGERTGPYENGRTTSQIKSNQTFQYLSAQVAGFRDVERAARSTNRSVRDTAAAIKATNIDKTIGGRLVGVSGRLDEIVKSYEGIQRPEGTKSADFVEELGAKAKDSKRQMGELTDRAKSLNEVLDKLRSQRKFLSLEGLDKQGLAQNSLRSLRNEMAGLIKAGAPIDSIKAKLSDGLINVEAARKDEEAIKRLLINLDKLKIISFQAGQEDYAGVQDRVLRAEKRLASEGQTGARGRNIKSIAAAEIFDIRQADAFNKVVTDGIDKLTKIGARQLTPKGRAVYEQETLSFEKYARNILANTPKIDGALRKLKLARDEFIYGAKLKAQGNFFDQISQAAGLATKRLAAFLIFAQGLYGIQSAITGSIGAAISLQNEFVKFEQILNKQFGGAKLTAELKSLNSEILDLGTNLGVSSAEIAKGAKIFTQAGITGRDLRDVLESITKAELGPTFEGITETAEGSVAIMNQFNIRGKDMEAVLGGINRVAAKFPVESKGIIEGVRRAGGAFSAAGNSIDDFVAAFTVIKSKTRETDESVATAARNLAISLQNAGVQEEIEKITGASLLEDGRFVGITRSIVILGEAVKKLNIQSDDPRFARLVTKIGGKRQFARLLPLIQEYEQLAKISKEFSAGATSLNEDVSVAFESIEVKITKAKESLVQLFTKIVNSDVFKGLVDNFTTLVQLSTAFLQNINSVIGVLAGGLIFRKFSSNIGSGLDYFRSQISGQVGQSPLPGFAGGGYIHKDGGAYKDKYHAMLAPGEYIMQGKAVDKYGVAFMEAINSGRLPKSVGGRAEGGLIGRVLGKTGSGIVSGLTKILVSFGKLSKSVEFAADDIKELDIIEAIGLKKNKNSQLVTDAIKQVKGGGQLDVVSILRSIGFSGRSGAIRGAISGIYTDRSLSTKSGALAGGYKDGNVYIAEKRVKGDSIEKLFNVLSHEIGHGITQLLSTKSQNKLLQAAPREFLAETAKRIQLEKAYGNPDLYNSDKSVRSEQLADIVRYTVAAKDKGIKDPRLDQIAKILAKSGVGIASDKQTSRLERARVSSLREDIGYGVLNQSYFGNRAGVGPFGYGPTGSRGGPPSGGPPPIGGGSLPSGGGGKDYFPTFKKLNTRIGGLSNTFKRLASSLSIYEKIVLGVVAATKLENAIGRETAESTIKLGAAIGSFAFTLTTVTSLLGKFAAKQYGGALLNNPVVQGILGNKGLADARATRTGGIIQSIRGSKPLAGGAVRSDEAKYIAELYSGGGRGANSINVNSELARIVDLRRAPKAIERITPALRQKVRKTRRKNLIDSLYGVDEKRLPIKERRLLRVPQQNLEDTRVLSNKVIQSRPVVSSTKFDRAIDKLFDKFENNKITNSIKSGARRADAALRQKALSYKTFFNDVISYVKTTGSKAGSSVKSAIGQTSSSVASKLSKSVNSVYSTVNNSFDKLISSVENSKVTTALKKRFPILDYKPQPPIQFAQRANIVRNAVSQAKTTGFIKSSSSFLKSSYDVVSSGARTALGSARVAAGQAATRAGGFLIKNLGRLAQVTGIAITALDFFANRTKENADKAVLESKSREEALKAFDNGAKGKGASAVTGAASGALLGSLIGSFVAGPGIGTAVGALIGGSFGYVLKAINGSGIGRLFSLTFSGISKSIKGAFKFFLGAADALDSAVLKLIDVFSGSSLLAEKELAKAVNRFFAGQTGSANRLSALQGSGRTFNKTDFAELISSFIGSTRILNRAGTLPDDIGKQAREQAIGSLGEFAQILDKLDVKSQGLVLGLLSEDAQLPDDIQKFLNNLGIEFKKKNAQAAIAFDAIDLFLAGISETAAKASARLTGISDAFARFSPNADRTNPLDSVFENIKDGFNPTKLGLGRNLGNFGAFRRQIGGFDPKLLKGFDFEANLASSSRRLTSSLVGLGGAALNLEGSTPADALGRFLSDAFEKASGGNKIVTEKFNQFIATKTEELSNSVDVTTGQINIGNSVKLVEEFVQQFGSKSIEQVQAIAKINSDFRSAYSKLFQERLQIEAEVVDSLKKFIDKNKSLEDFQGRVSGKTFAELLPDKLANAARRDRNRQSATLVGTGFNGSSSVQDLVKGLLAAQGRARNAGAIARAQVGPNGNLADLNAAEAAIRERALSDQEKLKAALSAVADGTELAALKMEAFEKAAEKAARSSEFLTNALLGTDEEFLNSARGAVNYQRILGAGDQGQARALLASMSEADRQALASFIGQDEGTKRKFQEATGIAPAVGQLPEAKAAEEEIKRQIEAQAGLTNALNAQIPQFTQSIAELQKFYLEQFNNSANIIAGFTNQLAVLTGQLTKLPEVIEHKMQGEVVVRIDGGDNLQKAIRDLVASSVNAQVSSAINDLVKANNLNPPRGAGFGNPIPDFAN